MRRWRRGRLGRRRDRFIFLALAACSQVEPYPVALCNPAAQFLWQSWPWRLSCHRSTLADSDFSAPQRVHDTNWAPNWPVVLGNCCRVTGHWLAGRRLTRQTKVKYWSLGADSLHVRSPRSVSLDGRVRPHLDCQTLTLALSNPVKIAPAMNSEKVAGSGTAFWVNVPVALEKNTCNG